MTKLGVIKSVLLAATGLALLHGPALAADQVTLNWALWDWDRTAYYKPLIEAYEASHPGVKIKYTDLGSADYHPDGHDPADRRRRPTSTSFRSRTCRAMRSWSIRAA